jgi:peptidoglycan hydrolase CwlO-like protein
MSKIFSLLLIIITLYLLAVFKAPDFAWIIEKTLWIEWTNLTITYLADRINKISAWLPDDYEKAKTNVIITAEYTKEKVDSVRETLDWAGESIEDIQKKYNEAKEMIEGIEEKINDTKEKLDEFSELWKELKSLAWSWSKILNSLSLSWTISSWSTNTWSLSSTWDTNTWTINN